MPKVNINIELSDEDVRALLSRPETAQLISSVLGVYFNTERTEAERPTACSSIREAVQKVAELSKGEEIKLVTDLLSNLFKK